MKKMNIFSGKTGFALILTLLTSTLLLSSCMKDPKPDPVGEAKIRYVNAFSGSSSQDLFVNDSKTGLFGVSYTEVSDRVTILSGLKNFFFVDEGTQKVNAATTGSILIGVDYLLFYARFLDGKGGIYGLGDNLSAPGAGKAKVRFVHLNGFLNNSIAIAVAATGGASLSPALSFGTASQYFEVDPGTKFSVSSNGVTNAPVIDGSLVAGKIYTIWIDGTSATELTGHVIVSN